MSFGGEIILEKNHTSLKPLDVSKACLFGSFANDSVQAGSDLDLLIILNIKTISKNYQERMENKLLVRNALSEINKEIPVDLLVYTKVELKILDQDRNAFFEEIMTKWKNLYDNS
jgi:predicted nucleotidyltransferase